MNEFRPGSFQMIPPVIKNLIIVNALVFLAQKVFENHPSINIENLFALHDVRSFFFKPHQLITYMFLHATLSHIFFNMFALWMFGAILENVWGPKRFLIFYFACGLGSAVLHLFVLHNQLTPTWDAIHQLPGHAQLAITMDPGTEINTATLGASGAVFGCLAAFGYLFPNSKLFIIPIPFPIKAKWFVLGYAALELYSGIQNSAGDNTAHWAHLGGAAVGILMVLYWQKMDKRHFY